MMKVLFITNFGLMYGANQSLFYMMKYLKKSHNVEPYLLVPGGGGIEAHCKEENINCICADFRISYIDGDTKWLPIRKQTRKIMRFTDYIRIYKEINMAGIKFDLIHSNSSVFDIGYFLARWWHIPHVWHIREFAMEDYNLHNVISKTSELRQYQKSNAIIAISESIRQYVKNKGKGIPLYRIYNGIEITEEYDKQYCKKGIVKFCIVGALNKKKNHPDVVKACLELLNKDISSFELYIIGDYVGETAEEINRLCSGHPELDKRIVRMGYRRDVNSLLKDMDVGIMASDKEAFGRVTIEYMANYMSVIGTNTGGTPELIKGVGDLFEPHDVVHLAELMEKYICHPRLLYDKRKQNRLQAERFTAQNNADDIYAIYEKIGCFD
ncbi:MAG: glycosyltransferase family 4 protein [Roseburia sp.]|nr:glycosyltransferase family 4 protein [Roseburia sp.]MCM1235029.1 glycosyltransferase family 4 protein [Ruminococcus flavefaciens]